MVDVVGFVFVALVEDGRHEREAKRTMGARAGCRVCTGSADGIELLCLSKPETWLLAGACALGARVLFPALSPLLKEVAVFSRIVGAGIILPGFVCDVISHLCFCAD